MPKKWNFVILGVNLQRSLKKRCLGWSLYKVNIKSSGRDLRSGKCTLRGKLVLKIILPLWRSTGVDITRCYVDTRRLSPIVGSVHGRAAAVAAAGSRVLAHFVTAPYLLSYRATPSWRTRGNAKFCTFHLTRLRHDRYLLGGRAISCWMYKVGN